MAFYSHFLIEVIVCAVLDLDGQRDIQYVAYNQHFSIKTVGYRQHFSSAIA